jgi:hypothetical protein
LRQASIKYHERKYEEVLARLPGIGPEDRINLLYPGVAGARRE